MKSLLVAVMFCVAALSFTSTAKASEPKALANLAKLELMSKAIDASVAKGDMTAEQGVEMKMQLAYSWSELGGDALEFYNWVKTQLAKGKDLTVQGFWVAVEAARSLGCFAKETREEMHACFAEAWATAGDIASGN